MPTPQDLIRRDQEALAQHMAPQWWSHAGEGMGIGLLWTGLSLGMAGMWLAGGALVLVAALAFIAIRKRQSANGPLGELTPRLMGGGKAGCLGYLALAALYFIWQIISDLWVDSGAGAFVALGIGLALGLACWAVFHRLQAAQARAIGDGSGLREIVGTTEPRVDPLFEDTDCLRICAALLLFRDLRATGLQRLLDMDDDRFQAAVTRLKSQLMVSDEPPVGRIKHADTDDWLHLTFQGETVTVHQLAAMETAGSWSSDEQQSPSA